MTRRGCFMGSRPLGHSAYRSNPCRSMISSMDESFGLVANTVEKVRVPTSSWRRMVLPEPAGPTIAACSPGFHWKEFKNRPHGIRGACGSVATSRGSLSHGIRIGWGTLRLLRLLGHDGHEDGQVGHRESGPRGGLGDTHEGGADLRVALGHCLPCLADVV